MTIHRTEMTTPQEKKGMNASLAMKSYRNVNASGMVMDASPHRLIQMLMQGALDRVRQASGCLERQDIEGRTHNINRAVEIIAYLQDCLNREQGGEVAENLHRLYGYMLRRLFDANMHRDRLALEEVSNLMMTVKEGWDAINDQK